MLSQELVVQQLKVPLRLWGLLVVRVVLPVVRVRVRGVSGLS
jgi:hypothetical protein